MENVITIQDLHDSRLVAYRDLRSGAPNAAVAGNRHSTFVVEGRWCLERLAQSTITIQSVLVESGSEDFVAGLVSRDTSIYVLPRGQIQHLVGFDFHRGVLACGIRPAFKDVDDLLPSDSRSHLTLAVLGVDLKENLGSMLRSAAAFGVRDVLIGPRTADPYARRCVRVSMGAVFHQTLYTLKDPVTEFKDLADRGYRTLATTLEDACPLDQLTHDDRPMILMVGSEANGIPHDLQEVATDRITIPMKLGTDSLNVSVATAIFLYQLSLPKGLS